MIDWNNVFDLLEMIVGASIFGAILYIFILISFSF